VIDYSFFVVPIVSRQNLDKLQSVQNRALRHILGISFNLETGRYYSSNTLNNRCSVDSVSSRLTKLTKSYLTQAQVNQNPLIRLLVDEYFDAKSEIEKHGIATILTGIERIT